MDKIEYTADQVPWYWVTSHYDFHLAGLAKYQGVLHWVQLVGHWDNYTGKHDDSPLMYTMTPLSSIQAVHWHIKKWLFEVCVGRHWSYPKGPKKRSKVLFRLYYNVLKRVGV